jgi:hypothetical protein
MTQNEWIINGETGISSRTMWAALNGGFPEPPRISFHSNIPHDPADFRRCKQFVEQCRIDKDQLQKIKKQIPWWGPFIDAWDELVALYEEERPSGKAPRLYARMQELKEQAMRLDGFVKISANSWKRIS